MKQKRIPMLAAIMLGAMAVNGCRTSVNMVANAQPQGRRQVIEDARVITDMSLNRKVSLVGLNTTSANGIMRLQVEVNNRRASAQTFFYTIEWFDQDGMRVSTATGGWVEKRILGRETMTITATAPNPNCRDFRMKLIEDPR